MSAAEETNKLYQTAGEETLQLQQSVAVWQWLQDDNTWGEYSQEQSNKLGEALIPVSAACRNRLQHCLTKFNSTIPQ